ncbi:MAG: TonB-dependent receptor [Chitinophagaceae bacterium]|nr:TonB-dependent receptor [Chitinophagaceae bacterium]
MKKHISVLVIFLAWVGIVKATGIENGKGQISGKVLTADGKPAASVTVFLQNTHFSTYTQDNGKFILRNIPAGEYKLEVSLVGHQTIIRDVKVMDQKTSEISIELSVSENELSEVVVTSLRGSYNVKQGSASLRLNAPLLEIPQNIQIVNSTTISDQQIISMSDNLIRNVSGAVRLEHWGDLYTNVMMRGSQIQAFRNGFNVVSSYWGPLTEDMSFVDHIEFVKGPAGFMLANGDPSGLYNVVTKKPTGQTKGEASFTMGSFDLYRLALDLDGKLSKDGKLLYRFNIAGQNKDSFRPNEFNNRVSIAPVISYQLDDKTKLTAEYVLQHANMSDVGSYYVFSPEGYGTLPKESTSLAAGLPATNINDQSLTVNLQHQLSDRWRFTAQTAYYNYKQEGSSLWPAEVNADGTIIRSVGLWDAKSNMSLAQAFLNGEVYTGGLTHKILTGVDVGNKKYFADWSQSHSLDLPESPFDPKNPYYGAPANGYPVWDRTLNIEARATNAGGLINQRYSGVYFQDDIGFFNNRLRVTIAGRYTYVSQSAWGGVPDEAKRFTPRAGVSYSIDRNTAVYGLYDQAFIPQSGRISGGAEVKPITGNNLEFGIKRDWANGKWNTTLSVYRIMKNNELFADPDSAANSGWSREIAEKHVEGVEFDIRGTVIKGLTLVANYAYTDAMSKALKSDPSTVSPGFAKHTTNGWLGYKMQEGVLKGFGINGGFTWLVDRATSNWNVNPAENLPDYFRLDGGLFWENSKVKLAVNVFNVLDKFLYSGGYYGPGEYFTSAAYSWQAEAPRNFRFSVNYKF